MQLLFSLQKATEGNNSSSKKQENQNSKENYGTSRHFIFLTIYDIFLQNWK